MSHPPRLTQARHAFLRLAPPLPLAYEGVPLRTALRQARASLATLIERWRDALSALHAVGFGTDDALSSARVPADTDTVHFDPAHVYPLGAAGRRPVAAWLDLYEAARWLGDQGSRPELVALFDAPPPWTGWPEAPSPLFILVGPLHECRALCDAADIAALDARALPALSWPPQNPTVPVDQAHLLAQAHLRRLPPALLGRRPLAVLVTPDDDTGALPLPARPRLVAQSVGAAPPPAEPASFEAFGLEALDRPAAPPPPPTARQLEDARLLDTPAQRAAAEAWALISAQVDAASRDLPPLPTERALDLAREGLDRAATQRAHLLRALLLAPLDPRRALVDLTEARRLRPSSDERPTAVARGLACVISHTLQIEPADGQSSPLLGRLADRFAEPSWDEAAADHALALAASVGLDLPELAPALTELCLGLVVERLGRDAILDATEEHTERALSRLVATVALPGPVAALARSWAVLCAARRGATASVRERLVQAADSSRPSPRPLTLLAAERYAFAARLIQKDGLVPLFVDPLVAAGATSPLLRMISGERPLHHEPQLLPWLATLALEGLTSGAEPDPGERRRATPLLAAQLQARPGCDLALGVALAGASLDVSASRAAASLDVSASRAAASLDVSASRAAASLDVSASRAAASRGAKVTIASPIDTPRARELLKRTALGEPHHERRALAVLAALPGGDADEREAIRRRLLALGPLTQDAGLDDPLASPEPPMDPPSAERRALGLLSELVRAAAGHPPYEGWCRALSFALGAPKTELGPATDAISGLNLVEDGDGWLLEPLSGAPPTRFAGPGHPITHAAPELVAKTLAALSPLFVPRREGAPADEHTAETLDEALRAGTLDFFMGVLPAFKRRELLLPTLRQAVDLGLRETHGLYRALANRWRIQDYQRFMDFLRRNDALLDYRPYRRGAR